MRSAALVTVATPGFSTLRTVAVSDLAVSWEVSKPGLLSGKLPWKAAAALAGALGRDTLLGAWVAWQSPQLGNWGGIVARNPSDVGEGMMELSADSFHKLLSGIVTRRDYTTATGSPGALAINAITDAATDRQLWLDAIAADDTGPTMRLDARGDDLYDVIDGIATDSGYEWNVALNDDWTISFELRKRIGKNRLGRVLYADGYNVVPAGTVSPSIDELANELHAVPGDQQWETAAGAIVADADSVRTYGRRAATRRYVGLSDVSSLETRGRLELATAAQPSIPAAITVPITDRQLPNVRIGDSVRYWSARQNKRYELRVFAISYESRDGTVKLSGDCADMDAATWEAA